jgi:hypothetical protein
MGGAVLWIGAALFGLVAVVLCVTVILLPLGIPLLGLARRMFTQSVALMLPRSVSHPLDEGRKKARSKKDQLSGSAKEKTKRVGKAQKKAPKKAKKVSKKLRKKASKLGR